MRWYIGRVPIQIITRLNLFYMNSYTYNKHLKAHVKVKLIIILKHGNENQSMITCLE